MNVHGRFQLLSLLSRSTDSKTLAIDVRDVLLGVVAPGKFGQRGKDIGGAEQRVALTARMDHPRAVDDQRHVDPSLGE